MDRIQGKLDQSKAKFLFHRQRGRGFRRQHPVCDKSWAAKKKSKSEINAAKTRSQRSFEDAKAAEGIGIAATRQEERGLAVTGKQDYAPSLFEHQESVLNADLNSKTSDYLLLQLNCTVDQISSFDVSFAGWSRNESDGYTDKTVTIHHPQGDIKKFTYSTIVPTSANNQPDPNLPPTIGGINTMWKIIWAKGVTAPGSSGGLLFNNNHKIIGQLYYGASTCDLFWLPDYYGKFSISFINGNFQNYLGNSQNVQNSTPSKPTLDLTITSVTVLGIITPKAPVLSNDDRRIYGSVAEQNKLKILLICFAPFNYIKSDIQYYRRLKRDCFVDQS